MRQTECPQRELILSQNKKNHQVNIVRLGEPRVHPNADLLELWDIGEYQCVSQKGTFKAGELAVYIQPDSVITQTPPFKFIWEQYVGLDGTVPEKRRRITVKKLRGEWSEGLLMRAADFQAAWYTIQGCAAGSKMEGDDVSELLGITHYDPDAGKESAADSENFRSNKKKRFPRTLKGWFFFLLHKITGKSFAQGSYTDNEYGLEFPVYDVESFKHYKNAFEPGEMVEVTEKIHGSNARFVFKDEHQYAGSRTQWKSEKANCIWRNVLKAQPWIEEWCRAHPGFGIYGEVCPTQGEKFQYGSTEPQLFVFDVRSPEGKWLDREEIEALHLWRAWEELNFRPKEHWVPVLYTGLFKDIPWGIVDGQTTVTGAKGIREGIVIRPVKERHVRGLGRLILKVVSKAYLEKETK